MSLKGKVALITGGSRGIGRAITLKLASEGADVIINYFRRTSQAELTAQEARNKGVIAHVIKANVGEPEKIENMFREIEAKFGKLDILISNAASGVARPALELDIKSWDWTMDINARALLLCAQKAAKLMPHGGQIVSISSLGSHMVMPVYTAVGVSKAALEALTRYLAIELASKGIRVNAIAPGFLLTEQNRTLLTNEDGSLTDRGNTIIDITPFKRFGNPEELIGAILWLASDASKFVTGTIIPIDGGFSAFSGV